MINELWLRFADLFNYGFYWEAADITRTLVASRDAESLFLAAMNELATAALSARTGSLCGKQRRCAMAAERICQMVAEYGVATFAGIDLDSLSMDVEWFSKTSCIEDLPVGRPLRVTRFILNLMPHPPSTKLFRDVYTSMVLMPLIRRNTEEERVFPAEVAIPVAKVAVTRQQLHDMSRNGLSPSDAVLIMRNLPLGSLQMQRGELCDWFMKYGWFNE